MKNYLCVIDPGNGNLPQLQDFDLKADAVNYCQAQITQFPNYTGQVFACRKLITAVVNPPVLPPPTVTTTDIAAS